MVAWHGSIPCPSTNEELDNFIRNIYFTEIVSLERVQYLSDRDSQFLQITQGSCRQVPYWTKLEFQRAD
jgi:hypothetical protein